MASTFQNLNIKYVDKATEMLSQHFYEMAAIVEGDTRRWETYMDAADAIMDVIAMWHEDEADPSTGAATA